MKNFKFHWGHGIVIALASFMIFIVSMIFFYERDKRAFDLVTEDYYEQELHYQDVIDAKNNAYNLPIKPEIKVKHGDGIFFSFPSEFKSGTKGEVTMYHVANKDLDKKFLLELDTLGRFYIPKENLNKANHITKYVAKLSWTHSGKSYHMEQNIDWK